MKPHIPFQSEQKLAEKLGTSAYRVGSVWMIFFPNLPGSDPQAQYWIETEGPGWAAKTNRFGDPKHLPAIEERFIKAISTL